jgi:hypothetical protein
MAITFRAKKGTPLTYSELDNNFGAYFYSASTDGQTVTLYYPAEPAVPVNSGSFTFNLVRGLQNAGYDRRIAVFSGSSAIETRQDVFIDRSGSLGVGVDESANTTLSYRLDVSGSIRATGTVLQASDERLKENIYVIDNALDRVDAIDGVYFNWKDREGRQAGVIAQQVQKVLPEVVSEDNNGYLNVDYGGIVPLLLEAIKELEARVKELENK